MNSQANSELAGREQVIAHSSDPINDRLFDAAGAGDVIVIATILNAHPDRMYVRVAPYAWTMLHVAAAKGQLGVVDLLLKRGLNVNTREQGDGTYAMHWAAAAGHVDVVQRLIAAGGDVVGRGDDHELEVIGCATCWDGCDDDAHRVIVDLLIARGAQHHIYSATATQNADEVRRVVNHDPSLVNRPQRRNEDFRRPLHFAVMRNFPEMVQRLLELGADPLSTDGSGYPAYMQATSTECDRAIVDAMLRRDTRMGLFAALTLPDYNAATRLLEADPSRVAKDGTDFGVLHLMAKRDNVEAVRWLLAHGVNANMLWPHWDSDVTPLHMAALGNHAAVIRLLLKSGADPFIHDTKHDSDARGWAEFFGRTEIVTLFDSPAAAL